MVSRYLRMGPMKKKESSTKRTVKYYALLTFGVFASLVLLFLLMILSLRWINPPFTAFTLQEDWSELEAERYNLRDHWVDYERIPDHLKWAVIVSEDNRFYEHWGIDREAIEKALEERERGESIRGASTITQQVAKNLFLPPAQTYLRKGIEAMIAVTIEVFWNKDRIIEVYLNTAEFGPGLFGIGKASDELLEKPASEMEPESSALFAAVLPSPKRMRINPPSPFAEERSKWVLRQMTHFSGVSYLAEIESEPAPDITEDPDPFTPEIEFELQRDSIRATSVRKQEDSLMIRRGLERRLRSVEIDSIN
ncbi:MAG: monofunctional biosynthetic peptidoglycan transglycosylase [Balneolaceae bacterium]